jgi:hypothetical protein
MKNSMTSTMRVLGCCCAMFYTLTGMGQSAEPTHQLAHTADLKWTPSFMGCEHAAFPAIPVPRANRLYSGFGVQMALRFRLIGTQRTKT